MTTETMPYSDLAIPPGEYLEEVLDDLGMTKDELARRMDRPSSKLNAIYKGDKEITPETALQLETVLGIPAHIWTGLEKEFRLTLARQNECTDLSSESRSAKEFPYRELCNLGFVKRTRNDIERTRELLRFFGVTSFRNIREIRHYAPAFRMGNKRPRQPSPNALAAWLRIGELKARDIRCGTYDADALKRAIPVLRESTMQPPKEFVRRIEQLLANAGVALIVYPHLSKTYVNGATFWLGPSKAVLLVTLRGSWADIFWFTLFHEIGHLLLHGKNRTFVETDDVDPTISVQEDEANRFAAREMIPSDKYAEFVGSGKVNRARVLAFSKSIGIHPGIVVGRLQKEAIIPPNWLNGLRERFIWT